jgi:DNA-binding transcriptional regulator YdaS (Cro superfamily)
MFDIMIKHDKLPYIMTRTMINKRKCSCMDATKRSHAMNTIERALYVRGKSRSDAAKACGVTPAAFTHWMSGKNLPSPKRMKVLSRVTGITVSDLLEMLDPTFIPPTPSA